MKRMIAIVLGGALALVGGTAAVLDAATTTTNLAVTASVGAACTVSATGVSFGNYTGAVITSNGNVSVNCASGTAYNVTLAAGNNFSGMNRRMAGASSFISYGLFQNAALTTEWGDGCTGGGNTYPAGGCVAGIGSGVGQVLTVFGQALAATGGVTPPAGNYSDTVVVTVIF